MVMGETCDGLSAVPRQGSGEGAFDGIICIGGEDWWYHNRGHFDFQIMRRLAQRWPVLFVNSLGVRLPSLKDNKLFVSRGVKPPKIADYAGRGDLRSWVRVTALRMIVDIVRQNNAGKEIPVESEMLGAMPAPNEDPELDYIQRVYKNEFKESLQKAFGNLTPRERNLLRHQVIHGLNIDQVGAIYRVHRTTAFRWIEKARKSLLRETRAELMSRLRVGTGELHSIMRVVQGDLDVSVRRLLVSEIEDEPGGKG